MGSFYNDANVAERVRAIVRNVLARAGNALHFCAVVTDAQLESPFVGSGLQRRRQRLAARKLER